MTKLILVEIVYEVLLFSLIEKVFLNEERLRDNYTKYFSYSI